MGEAQTGKTKYIHYFDSTDNTFDFITETVVQDNGRVVFGIEHCSDYVLSDKLLDTASETEKEETGTTENEQTGEENVTKPVEAENNNSAVPVAIVVIIIVVIAGAILIIKKRKAE